MKSRIGLALSLIGQEFVSQVDESNPKVSQSKDFLFERKTDSSCPYADPDPLGKAYLTRMGVVFETSVQEGRRLGEKKLNYWLDQDEEMPFSSKNAPHRGLEYPLNLVLLLKREVEAPIVVYSALPGLPKPLAAEKLLK
ncbi:hypothetical protein SDJN03_18696, partial [Cucurbita argyrosperma subsp. sororia]